MQVNEFSYNEKSTENKEFNFEEFCSQEHLKEIKQTTQDPLVENIFYFARSDPEGVKGTLFNFCVIHTVQRGQKSTRMNLVEMQSIDNTEKLDEKAEEISAASKKHQRFLNPIFYDGVNDKFGALRRNPIVIGSSDPFHPDNPKFKDNMKTYRGSYESYVIGIDKLWEALRSMKKVSYGYAFYDPVTETNDFAEVHETSTEENLRDDERLFQVNNYKFKLEEEYRVSFGENVEFAPQVVEEPSINFVHGYTEDIKIKAEKIKPSHVIDFSLPILSFNLPPRELEATKSEIQEETAVRKSENRPHTIKTRRNKSKSFPIVINSVRIPPALPQKIENKPDERSFGKKTVVVSTNLNKAVMPEKRSSERPKSAINKVRKKADIQILKPEEKLQILPKSKIKLKITLPEKPKPLNLKKRILVLEKEKSIKRKNEIEIKTESKMVVRSVATETKVSQKKTVQTQERLNTVTSTRREKVEETRTSQVQEIIKKVQIKYKDLQVRQKEDTKEAIEQEVKKDTVVIDRSVFKHDSPTHTVRFTPGTASKSPFLRKKTTAYLYLSDEISKSRNPDELLESLEFLLEAA